MKGTIRKKTYKKTQTSEVAGLSQYALTMRLYKEMLRRLEVCEYAMNNRPALGAKFFDLKSTSLGKVLAISAYLIETTDKSADTVISDIFIQMYTYVYQNAMDANLRVELASTQRAKEMVTKIIEVWGVIPETSRY
ncbi:flagellar protein FliS [Photobacterium kishitanii]|uniref:Flagellar secretion chaperone FliS n=1 Tax=Photobacterium kishitanii TaxID=318456 RepID=A0A2T3KMS3_9GAMM|nr:flagellar protein FliS [Photobacterium kishitanii]PSV01100.1 hypothetical protein C9J27_03515 [Photobacterium kishitanii]